MGLTFRIPGALRRNVVRIGHPAAGVKIGLIVKCSVDAGRRVLIDGRGLRKHRRELVRIRNAGVNCDIEHGVALALEFLHLLRDVVGLALGVLRQGLIGQACNDAARLGDDDHDDQNNRDTHHRDDGPH